MASPGSLGLLRYAHADVEVGGVTIARGDAVIVATSAANRDDAVFADPDEFDPTRFLGAPLPANTWIPFGGGVRRCLGAGFSLMEATAILREVLRQGMVLTGYGIVVGTLAALAVGQLVAEMLAGLRPSDPIALGTTVVILAATALWASFLPARRATKVDPLAALRND